MMTVFAALMIYIFFFSGIRDDLPVVQLKPDVADTLKEGWKRETDDGIQVTFTKTLPDIPEEGIFLAFRNFSCAVRVEISGKPVYTFGIDEPPVFHNLYGSNLCLVSMEPEYANEEIRIIYEVSHLRGSIYSVGNVLWGSKGDIIISVLWKNMDTIVIVFVMAVIGATALISFVVHALRKREKTDWTYLHIALFILLSTVWIFTDSLLVQFLTSGTLLYGCILSFLSLMLIPQPALSIAAKFCPGGRKHFYCLQMILWIYTIGAVLMYIGNAADLLRTLPVLHFLMVVTAVEIMYFSAKEYRETRNIYAGYCFRSIVFLFGVLMFELLGFYAGFYQDISIIFRYGLLVLTVCFLSIGFKKQKFSIEYNSKLDLYRRMAYLDTMTGLQNRNAYNQQVEYLQNHELDYRYIAVVMVDINNLKYSNDNMGHDCGDRLIQLTATLLREVFPEQELCYRIGGDEFVVILFNRELQEEGLRQYIEEKCRDMNESEQIWLSVSVGCAGEKVRDGVCDVQGLIKKADERMYENKLKWKKSSEYR